MPAKVPVIGVPIHDEAANTRIVQRINQEGAKTRLQKYAGRMSEATDLAECRLAAYSPVMCSKGYYYSLSNISSIPNVLLICIKSVNI